MNLRTVVCVLICVTWTIATHDGPPVIKEHPEDVLTRRNEPATLNCAASGATRIQWYRNGEPVLTDNQESRSERVLPFEGSLYFMRVTANRRQNDAGTYWCVASNERGSTKSKTATLTIASIGSQFLQQPPPSVRVRQGESLTLPCRPPKGTPNPVVKWEREGQVVVNTTRVMTSLEGDLVFDDVIEDDSGIYVCKAQNLAGTRESQPSSVHITSPPWFVERPKNISTVAGATIEFECRARGSPPPTVIWRRLDGKMPLERTHLREKSAVLRMTEVSSSDSGMYVCEAENEAGKAMTLGSLKVVVAPEVKEKPGNTLTLVGKDLILKCEVKGEPTPLLVWKLPHHDKQTLLSGGQSNKHASVSPNGTVLSVQALEKEDTGAYYCWGISSGGGVSSRAEVVVVDAFPPPLIGVRPSDLHVPPGATASFPCEVASEASAPTITWWFRRAAHLEPHQVGNGASVTQLQTGTLVLKEVTEEDAGIYECRVSSGAGTVEAEAILRVEAGAAGPHAGRRSSASLAPAPPSKPRIVYYNSSAAQLSWLPNSRGTPGEGADSYTVEYWRASWQEWRVAKADIRDTSALIEDLAPNAAYVFLVRAINARGESFPSPWSDMIYTSAPGSHGVNLEEERQTRRKLNRPTVALVSARGSSSTLVTLTWELLDGVEVPVDGVIVYTVGEDSVETATVFGVASNSHRVRGLKPNSHYTFFLVPFSKTIEGIPSNSLGLTTPQEAPSVAPSGLRVETFEEGTTLVKWTPLSEAEAGGEVIGYHVSTTHNSTSTLRETNNPWLELRGLEQGRLYTVRVAGVSGGGVGPWSPPELIDMSSGGSSGVRGQSGEGGEEEDVPSVFYTQPHPFWVLYITVPVLLLLVVLGMIYLVNVRRKATPSTLDAPMGPTLYSSSGVYGPPHQVNMYGDQKVWRPSDSDQDSSLSSARLLRPEHLANEYAEPRLHRPLQDATTEPYATTALLAPASPRPGRTTNHGWRPCPEDIQLNWAALIPPPPSCPPPLNFPSHEGETCSSASTSESGERRHCLTGSSSQYENTGGCSEQYERPCDFTSHCSGDRYSPPGATTLEGFQTFNTLQGTPGRRVTVDLHPTTRAEPPKSNTH